jgi:uncharacterized membrane protein YfcA
VVSILFGLIVGVSLGLTGGGGAVFAVPLLVYGEGLSPREAVGVSLFSVGATALAGFLSRLRRGDIELRPGLLFAAAGVIGAPLGTAIAARMPEMVLMLLLGLLMVLIAVRMWWANPAVRTQSLLVQSELSGATECSVQLPTAACRRDSFGQLLLTTRCARLLLTVGLGAGVLSGTFGVGGGFLIVPALVEFSGMTMRRAVGTSLLVIFLVSISGIVSRVFAGEVPAMASIGMFLPGCLAGLWVGQAVSRRLPQGILQRIFSAAIMVVAVLLIVKNFSE